jgi:hypothetical protein
MCHIYFTFYLFTSAFSVSTPSFIDSNVAFSNTTYHFNTYYNLQSLPKHIQGIVYGESLIYQHKKKHI